jgi:beta-lactamase regulating signal transducer with metallopeptidase domain
MNDFIDAVVTPLLGWLADWSLRWAVLIAVLAAGLVLLRPRRTAARYRGCLLVLLAGLCLPFVPRWGPALAGPQPAAPPRETPPPPAQPLPAEKTPVLPAPSPAPPAFTPSHVEDLPPAPEPPGIGRLAMAALFGGWGAGGLLLLLRQVGGRLWLRRLRRTALPVAGKDADLLAACCAELGLRRPVVLASHPAVRSPLALGLWRPAVLVPPGWPGLPAATRRGILLHELAHLRRRDDWWGLLFETVRAVFFFHPLVRWLLARLECERELLCDEAAVARGLDPRAYALMLLECARRPGRLLPAPLAGSAYPLGIGGRRTVMTRISHLLEENMQRWLTPTPTRSTLTVTLLVVALAVGLGSVRLGAGEPAGAGDKPDKPEQPAAPANETPVPKIKKEALRYGGKNFDQWRTDLLTELKPEIRIDGIKALREFGANGYGAEATAAILEVVRAYDYGSPNKDDLKVLKAGVEAMHKIGQPAVALLIRELAGDNRNGRRFAVEALVRDAPREAVPALVEAIRRPDDYVRTQAIQVMRLVDLHAAGLVNALAVALQDGEPLLRIHAAQALGEIGPGAAAAVPALVEALRDKDQFLRTAAVKALGKMKPPAASVVAALTRLVKEESNAALKLAAIEILGGYGPTPPGLYRPSSRSSRRRMPTARSASPPSKPWAGSGRQPGKLCPYLRRCCRKTGWRSDTSRPR